jgi:hypothetical protein
MGVRAMSERLRASDLALLADETPHTPMHNATLEIFDPADSGFDYDALLAHIDDRIAFVPRYRQHVRRVPVASRTRCGSTTRSSTSPTTYAVPPCPARARSTSSVS